MNPFRWLRTRKERKRQKCQHKNLHEFYVIIEDGAVLCEAQILCDDCGLQVSKRKFSDYLKKDKQ